MKRNVRRQQISVALFPFLAVLICTMGSLIVLLVVFVHQATVAAKNVAQASPAGDPAEARQRQERLEDAQWRRDLLEQQRAEKTAELADSRARLAHLEEHIQRLEAQAQQLLARAKEIDEGRQLRDDELATAQAELARLQREIAGKKSELTEAQQKQRGQEQWYALIPYDGPNGTRRRPIYLECTDQGIVIQPEGIVFRPEDFRGPLGPGNPLDAALRTIREYLNQAGGKLGEPYPLIVVRPSGVVAYGAARSALRNWDDEFGYELVSDDKKLAFGDADPNLTAQLQRSVAVARQRQVAMLAATPRRYADEEPITSFDPADVPGQVPEAFAGGGGLGGSGRGPGAGIAGSGTGTGTGGGTGSGTGDPVGSTAGMGGRGTGTGNQPGSGYPRGAGTGGFAGAGPYQPGGGTVGSDAAGTGTSGGQTAGGRTAGSGAGGSTTGGGTQQPGSQSLPGGSYASGTRGAASGSPGGSSQPGQTGGQAGQGGASASGDASQSASANSSTNSTSRTASRKPRGNNWGLPNAPNRTTGITRPIRVAVQPDRLILVPDRGTQAVTRQVPMSPQVRPEEIDALVAAVQQEMKTWGLAVQGGYWKPILRMEVAPGAEQRFAELQTALQGSGYEIIRK
ncbi:MAG: hypothetical protein SFU86_09265 [Pirellulaceae bacterium]|nr:hypothetical protein [Pirellulaceae bacterium]